MKDQKGDEYDKSSGCEEGKQKNGNQISRSVSFDDQQGCHEKQNGENDTNHLKNVLFPNGQALSLGNGPEAKETRT